MLVSSENLVMKINSESVGSLLGAALLVSSFAVVAAPGKVDNGVSAEKSAGAVAGENENPQTPADGRQLERKFRVRILDDSDERARSTEEEDHNH
jgi:hypothetical protein